MKINPDIGDLLFRLLLCTIFLGLGAEHLFSDDLIRRLMPPWVPVPRLASALAGIWLLLGGTLILLGWKVRWAGIGLGIYVALVSLVVHLPGVIGMPAQMEAECQWLWDILQRSNLVKNLCLIGVCIHLLNHKLGRFSLESRRSLNDQKDPNGIEG